MNLFVAICLATVFGLSILTIWYFTKIQSTFIGQDHGKQEGNVVQETITSKMNSSQWTNWSTWSQCPVTCGSGIKRRERLCIGSNCEGPGVKETSCELEECPILSEWSEWSRSDWQKISNRPETKYDIAKPSVSFNDNRGYFAISEMAT